jgi:Flp pilus assembly pilin Flp
MSARPLCLGDRGSVTVEYTVLLVLVALGTALATKALGPSLVRAFLAQQTWLLLSL